MKTYSAFYDGASRLNLVTSGTAAVGYSYLANSPLVQHINFTNSATQRMVTTKQYDSLNRLTSIQSLNSQLSTLNSFAYDYNSANQRTVRREADGAYWRFVYDALGQVKDGKKFWPDGSPVPGQQFEYAFDDIGNRTRTRSGGDQYGGALRSADYGANLLNQYTNRVVPASFDVLGVANGTNNVTVNGSPADYRRGEYFQEVVNVANSSTAVWQGVAVTNTYTGAYEIGHVFVPKTPEVFRHDLDGNLTNDGRWKFVWDPENRLVKLVADSGVGPQHWIAFQYDWRGRRVAKSIGPIGSEEATNTVKFIYDDWNLIAILDSESSVLESFSWGSDLSGSMQGAGGVGGLLFVSNPSGGMHFPSFDGNGNVMALVSAQDASLSAQYEYGPFGETIRATGPMSAANPFRFSTKFQDEETTLLYYGYRYYASSTGSWISRDPIEEKGFTRFFRITSPLHGKAAKTRKDQLSLYAIAGNALIGSYDVLGLLSDAGNNYSSAYCCPEVANWITCSEICKLALRDYKINPTIAGGGVVCYHGKACGCLGALRLVGYYPGECPQIDEVIRYHEDQHAPKADCSKCGFYRMAKWKDGVDDTQEECEQRKESLRRLISIKDNLDEKCQSVAITLIGLLVDQTKDCPPTEE